MNKIIINVGRQIGSGGHIIAEKLAEDFGCKCYDRELLNLAAKESGFSEKFFEQNDEQKGFFKSLFHTHLPFLSDNSFYHNDFSQEGLYKFQSDAIRKAADEGNCVFVGRTADYVLRDYKNVINIFITANIDDRIKAVCKRKDIDRSSARKFIESHVSSAPLTTITIQARSGDTARATTSASTAAIWESKKQRSLSQNLSERSSDLVIN